MKLRNLTPFLMLDHFHVSEGAVCTFHYHDFALSNLTYFPQGFPDHPHRGQATVTYMLEGSSRHEDSAGHKGTIETGGVQWMIAGKGSTYLSLTTQLTTEWLTLYL